MLMEIIVQKIVDGLPEKNKQIIKDIQPINIGKFNIKRGEFK